MVYNPWGDASASTKHKDPIEPIWKIKNFGNEKKVLKWFNNTLPILEELSRDRIKTSDYNIDWYLGNYDENQTYRLAVPGRRDIPLQSQAVPMIINHLWDLTEQHVARLSRFKPAVSVLPPNDEWNDKVSADLSEIVLKNIFYLNDIEKLSIEVARWTKVLGEAWVFADWDKNFGDVKDYDTMTRYGDVRYRMRSGKHVLLEPKRRFEDVNWMVEICDIAHIDEVRKRFKKPKLEPDKSTKIYSYADAEEDKRADEIAVYRVICKPYEFLPEGAVFYLTKGALLKVEDRYPWSHNDLPCERVTDIDVPEYQHGISFYQQLIPLQEEYNKLSTLIRKNVALTAHPKWKMPKSACKLESLGNEATIVEYTGDIAPSLEVGKSVSPETFAFRSDLKEEMQQLSGIHGVSRGDPPPGIRAGIALQFLEEQEQQRASTAIIKHNNFIRRLAKKTLGIVGDRYKMDDKRMIRVVGKNNQYQIRHLKNTKLSGPYDVRVQNTTALSESKAGRIAQLIELKQNFPNMLTDEEVVDLLDLGQSEKFYDIATAALRCAESENEDLLSGREVQPPDDHEHLLIHWRTHTIMMQSRSYKEDVPEKYRQAVEEHLMYTEYLMFERAKNNLKFDELLKQLEYFPVIYATDPPTDFSGAPRGAGPAAPPGIPGMPGGMPGGPEGPAPGVPPAGITEPPALRGEPVPQGDIVEQGAPVPNPPAPRY